MQTCFSDVISMMMYFFLFRSYEDLQALMEERRKENPSTNKKTKIDFAFDYINTYVNFGSYLNTIPDKSGTKTVNDLSVIPVKELPFRTLDCFYKEMKATMIDRGYTEQNIPRETTFRRAFKHYNTSSNCRCKTRWLRQKGSHATCEVCINCSKLLQERGKRFNEPMKDVIRKYRTAHLEKQAGERDELNRNREKARRRECAFLFGDFMSEYTTKLPHIRYPANQSSKEDAKNKAVDIRLYGIEVIYGEIEGIFCYLVPGYLPGGNKTDVLKHYYLHSDLTIAQLYV